MLRVLLVIMLAVTAPAGAMATARETGCQSLFSCLFDSPRTTAVQGRRTIAYPDTAKYRPGSIVVSTPKRRLYFILPAGFH